MPCSRCESQACFSGVGDMPDGCPELNREEDTAAESVQAVMDYAVAVREKETDRISELIDYAGFRGYKTIGIAGCIGLHDELRVITGRFKDAGFVVNNIMCKAGSLTKKEMGVPSSNRMTAETGYSIGVVACNPVARLIA